MLNATFQKVTFQFIQPAGTSRGVLHAKESWFLTVSDPISGNTGIGECSLLPGLSPDAQPGLEGILQAVAVALRTGEPLPPLHQWPAVRFAVEMGLADMQYKERGLLFPSEFTSGERGIEINGLIWMGNPDHMARQVEAKLGEGYTCIKLKVGALAFDEDLALLKSIRSRFTADEITIRVDANGAFTPADAPEKLHRLSAFDLHSIEQPIRAGQWEDMARLAESSPVPIALDEELIGHSDAAACEALMQTIRPPYIVIKPSLTGGFAMSDLWIGLAEKYGAGWWLTSALESNIGLSAIAQYCASKSTTVPQGLGTGKLFYHNFTSPLAIANGLLTYGHSDKWNYSLLQ